MTAPLRAAAEAAAELKAAPSASVVEPCPLRLTAEAEAVRGRSEARSSGGALAPGDKVLVDNADGAFRLDRRDGVTANMVRRVEDWKQKYLGQWDLDDGSTYFISQGPDADELRYDCRLLGGTWMYSVLRWEAGWLQGAVRHAAVGGGQHSSGGGGQHSWLRLRCRSDGTLVIARRLAFKCDWSKEVPSVGSALVCSTPGKVVLAPGYLWSDRL